MTITALHGGAAYHCETLEAPRYAGLFDALVRPEELDDAALAGVTRLVVPCRMHPQRLLRHHERFNRFINEGGTLVAMGETFQDEWLDGVVFHPVPTNFWWWLDPKADLGVTIEAPGHPLMAGLSKRDVSWHLHGWYEIPAKAEMLLSDESGRPILYAEPRGKGRLVVTSLDPFYHHGSHFMPATTRFLDRFLPNLAGWAGQTSPADPEGQTS
jgi:hypothetical protein